MPQSRRQRRLIGPTALLVARLAGWRYSTSRQAWVHRLAGGRLGPVFVTELERPPTRSGRAKPPLPRREDWRRTGRRHRALGAPASETDASSGQAAQPGGAAHPDG